MCAVTRIVLVGLMVIASTRRCGRPRFADKVKRTVDTGRASA